VDVPSNFDAVYFLYVEYPHYVAKMLDFLATTELMNPGDGLVLRLKKIPKHDTVDLDWWKRYMEDYLPQEVKSPSAPKPKKSICTTCYNANLTRRRT
jgi:hypothetical protein